MKYADSSLLLDIDKKREKVLGEPSFYLRRSQRISSSLTASSKMYSWWIEHPKFRAQLLDKPSSQQRGKIISFMREGVGRLVQAWNHLNSAKYPFTTNELISTAHIIEPTVVNLRDYRVSLNFENYTPPNPLRVPERLEELFSELRSSGLHPVEGAAIAHLGIAGTQPFTDGNKRTARLYQDKILCDAGLVPAVIYSGERAVYLDLLESALVGRRDGDVSMQKPFFDYIGGKVNVALDRILNDLQGNHH